jgi:Glycosyl transferase family 11
VKIHVLEKSGLGNQLFQYAAGLYFAKKFGATLEVMQEPEAAGFSYGHPRPFLLSHFSITAPVRMLTAWDRLIYSSAPVKKLAGAAARAASGTMVYDQRIETDRTFLPTLPVALSIRNLYLRGNFQAYQYAADVEQTVRAEFRPRTPATGKNLEVLEEIRACENPVSLHVRHGDYAVDYGGRNALSTSYHAKAMRSVLQQIARPTFFVFSDDIAFAREKLPKGERMVFLDHNDEATPHEDLRLMSACRHHIIANSTFSWWGAWLNPDPAKLVCAPEIWRDPHIPFPDILPPSWQRIGADTPTPLSNRRSDPTIQFREEAI